jgi:hypothetical protein
MKELEETTTYEGGYTPETPVIKYIFFHLGDCGTFCMALIKIRRKIS